MKKLFFTLGSIFVFTLFLIISNFSINSNNLDNDIRSMEYEKAKPKPPIILQDTEIGNEYKKQTVIPISNTHWKQSHIAMDGPDLGYSVQKNVVFDYYSEMPTPPQHVLDKMERKRTNPTLRATPFTEDSVNQLSAINDVIDVDDYLDDPKKKLTINKSELASDKQKPDESLIQQSSGRLNSDTSLRAPIILDSIGVGLGTTFATSEPAAAINGDIVFMTGNTWAGRSVDGGDTFSFVNPASDFPLICCDQDVVYNSKHDVWVWYRQGDPDASLGGSGQRNEIKISVSTDDAATWCTLTFNDTFINAGLTDHFIDYPHMQATDDKLYISTNIFPNVSGSFMSAVLRFDLAQIASCNFGNHQTFLSSNDGTLTPVNGATDTMYFASNINPILTRVYSWADNSLNVNSNDVTIPSYVSTGYSCPMPDTAANPCGRSDPRIMGGYLSNEILGFVWDAAQGDGFTYPYVYYLRVNAATGDLIGNQAISSASAAHNFANFGVNNAGDIGIGIFRMGGGETPSYLVGIDDSLTGVNQFDFATVKTSSHGVGYDTWGDYVRIKAVNPANGKWTATGFTMQGGSFDNNVENLFVIFSRSVCSPPSSGTWTITASCTLAGDVTVPGNVVVPNGVVLTIPTGVTLDINFGSFNLTVQSGGGVLIQSGGKVT